MAHGLICVLSSFPLPAQGALLYTGNLHSPIYQQEHLEKGEILKEPAFKRAWSLRASVEWSMKRSNKKSLFETTNSENAQVHGN